MEAIRVAAYCFMSAFCQIGLESPCPIRAVPQISLRPPPPSRTEGRVGCAALENLA